MGTRYVHTNIIADDWKRLADFYRSVFDCRPVPPERNQSGAWLERGTGVKDAALRGIHLRLPGHGERGPTLEIYSYAEMKEKPSPAANRQGLRHLAFLVDDVEAVKEKVLAQGGKALGEVTDVDIPEVGKLEFVYMSDPEGNILEIQRWT